MQAIIDALSDFAQWIYDTIVEVFVALGEFLHDVIIWALDGVLGAIGDIIAAIPVPDFLLSYSLSGLFAGMHPVVGYFGAGLNIAQGFGLIAAAFGFRMLRKALTLFQW